MSSMNIGEQFRNMSLGEKIILIAGPLLLIASFLPWYSVDICGDFGDIAGIDCTVTRSGWQSPGALWSILAVLIGVVLAGLVAATRLFNVQMPALPEGVTWARIYLGGAVLAGIFILLKLVNESSHLGFGFFIGIVLVGALIAGGFLMFQEEQGGSGPAKSPGM